MKLNQLKSIVKTAVKEAIQEEMKDILLEAIKTPKQVVSTPTVETQPLPKEDKLKLRENMMGVLDSMRPGANGTLNATSADVPMQVTGPVDNANGSLPNGNVSMDQIMGLMNSKG
jgi:hypothetical protein|tara:strand:- start:794 stop:1138 length:345 start_codon:yes stop_codon:yes gene_type:complete